MRHLVLDTETTGLSATEGHRIIEIGAVEMVNLSITGRSLHLYINPVSYTHLTLPTSPKV